MLDDGEIERRVRLIRPMEQHSFPLKMMAESHWVEADRERFAAAWLAELVEVPQFTESTIHVAAGLLLPIWKRLPNESTRVYRLQTDAGERDIGRKVSATWVANILAADAPALTPDAAFAALMEGRTVLELAEGLQLRRARVMGAYRIELSGFNDTMRDRLRAYGLLGEIMSWKQRMFVPTEASGVEILSKLVEQYPVARISEREAAWCRAIPPTLYAASRARPNRCADTIFPMADGRGGTGWSATSTTRPAARCSCGCRTRRRGPPASGVMPRPASMAISSISSAQAWACATSARWPRRQDAS
jgi:hypothetical protein